MENQIVTCGGMDCSVCSLLEIFQNIFIWLLGLVSIVAILTLIIAGVLYILNLGDKKLLIKAKRVSLYTLVGFIITLASFIAVNTLYLVAGVTAKDNWFRVVCSSGSVKRGAKTEPEKTIQKQLNLEISGANSVFKTVQDPKMITTLDVSGLNAENLWQDVLALKNGQRINFITSQNLLNEKELGDYVGGVTGFFVSAGGDRTDGIGIEDTVSIVKEEGKILLLTGGDNPELIGEFDINVENGDRKKAFETLIDILKTARDQGKNIYVYNDRNQEENTSLDMNACTESGGEVTVFQNECRGRKYVCGEKNVKCTNVENEILGCQCPVGSCLKDQKCVKIEETEGNYERNDQDYDSITDTSDRCPNTPEGETVNEDRGSNDYGCSCSQMYLTPRTCPQSRCEGNNFVTYPSSGQDTCVDGKRIEYLCTPQVQFSQQCQQSASQNFPITGQPSGGSNQQQNLIDLLKGLTQGGGSGGGSGGGGSGGGSGGGGSGSAPTGSDSPTDTGASPQTPITSDPSLTQQEAFTSGNGSIGSPYEMSDKAMEKAFTYNEQTGKLELDKNWESKLGVAGKDAYVKVPDKEKIVDAVDKKRKKDGKKELTDEQKDKLKEDKDAVKSPKGAKVVDKESNKEQTVDKDSKEDPSKTSDDSLDSEKQILKARKPGDPDYRPQTAKEQKAENMGLVKAEDGTFIKKNKGATDYFTPEVAGKLKEASRILKDEHGLGLNLMSGYRTYEEQASLYANQSSAPVAPPGRSNHNSGQAADVSLVNLSTGRSVSNNAVLRSAMSKAGLKNLPSEWWHYSVNGR